MSQASNTSQGICRVFASGKTCRFGNNCRYIHSDSTSMNQDEALNVTFSDSSGGLKQLCRSYSKSRFCKYGIRCKYLHKLPEGASTKEVNPHHHEGLNRSEELCATGSSPAEEKYFALPLPNRQQQNATKGSGFEYNDSDRSTGGKRDDSSRVRNFRNGPRAYYSKRKGHGQEPNRPQAQDDGQKAAYSDRAHSTRGKRTCKFFKAGYCARDQQCRFFHPAELANANIKSSDRSTTESNDTSSENKHVSAVIKPHEVSLDEMTSEQVEQHRETEMVQLTKRYPKAKKVEDSEDCTSFRFTFKPTDPDWVYDVKDVILDVTFPKEYPKKEMEINLMDDQDMPETVIRYISISIKEWIEDRFFQLSKEGKVELMFRPFLKWLDRSLEEMFTEGLKQYKRDLMAAAAGVQFISASQLKQEYSKKQSSDDSDETSEESDDSDCQNEAVLPAAQPSHIGEMPPASDSKQNPIIDPARKGTEVKLQKLVLAENATTLVIQKFKITVQCVRCKNKMEVTSPAGQNNQMTCGKCCQEMLIMLRSSMAHQFSSVIGYLDLFQCMAFDFILPDCTFDVGCFNCNKEMKLDGLSTGQPRDLFCFHCHKKLRVSTESVRFQQLQPSDLVDVGHIHVLEAAQKKKMPKDPAIQEGKPLPGEGTCKHYKKSFRWLRFPCCGKAYPCDICHDDNEGDHEMAFANRMICGFCCKEQAYAAERACVMCGSSLIKKSSSHWEGGKGCRDKVKMSRDDVKKFASMNKTISRKSQAKKETKSKKTTKLRHV